MASVLLAACLLVVSPVAAYSSMFGSMAASLPALFFAVHVARRFGPATAAFLRAAVIGEAGTFLWAGLVFGGGLGWVGGRDDVGRGVIRGIGKPLERLRADPVRMLRAVHFAQRMDFVIEPTLEAAIVSEAAALEDASQPRIYFEMGKMLSRGRARGTFLRMRDLGLLRVMLPDLAAFLGEPVEWPVPGGGVDEETRPGPPGEPNNPLAGHATWNLLGAADRCGLAANKAPESLALAVLFGPWLMTTWRRRKRRGFRAYMDHVEELFRPVAVRMNIPRWATLEMRDALWFLDDLRHPPSPERSRRLVRRAAFRTALSLYELDLMAKGLDTQAVEPWRRLAAEEGVPPAGARKPPSERAPRGGPRGTGRRGGRRRGGRRRRGRGARDGREPGSGARPGPA